MFFDESERERQTYRSTQDEKFFWHQRPKFL